MRVLKPLSFMIDENGCIKQNLGELTRDQIVSAALYQIWLKAKQQAEKK